jgi:hypothetical protein
MNPRPFVELMSDAAKVTLSASYIQAVMKSLWVLYVTYSTQLECI